MTDAAHPATSALITYLDGIDVSAYQGHAIDWPTVARSGIAWAYCKALEGATNPDDTFAGNMSRGRAAGVRMGGYLFHRVAHLDHSEGVEARAMSVNLHANDQADRFIAILRANGWTPDDLPPAVDVEAKDGASDDEVARSACIVLRRLEAEFGVVPVLYTYLNFAAVFLRAPEVARFPLWLASYTSREPPAPLPWTSWWAWQWSGKAIGPGVATPCDRSRMVTPLP